MAAQQRLPVGLLLLVTWAEVGASASPAPTPPAPVPLDFVPEFSYRARVVALDPPPPTEGDPKKKSDVRTIFEWGWGQRAGETVGIGSWGATSNFTRNGTAAKWAKSYPNTYGLQPRYFTGKHEDDQVLVTHLFVCHEGTWPSRNDSLRDSNQTTDVEVEVTLSGAEAPPFTLGGVLVWGNEEGACDDLGIVVGQHKSTGKHFVETFAQYNRRRYWGVFEALPAPRPGARLPTQFPIMDSFRTDDGDIQASRDALRASAKLGLHGLSFSGPAWLQDQELGRERHFLRHLYVKCIILPRQARDKHRESTRKREQRLTDPAACCVLPNVRRTAL